MTATTQVEIELLRNVGSSMISTGQHYHQYADFLEGKAPAGTPNGAPAGIAPPPSTGGTVVSFPAPAGAAVSPPPAPGAAAATAPAAATRKRRTKAEIAADEAAVAAGFVDAADMAAKQSAGAGVPPANVPPAPGMPGNLPPAMPGAAVAPPPPPPAAAAPVAPATTPHDNLQAALMGFGQAVENTWPGQGHGNGQMGLVIKKMGVPNVQAIPAESVQGWTDWIVGITAQFRADPSKLASLTA